LLAARPSQQIYQPDCQLVFILSDLFRSPAHVVNAIAMPFITLILTTFSLPLRILSVLLFLDPLRQLSFPLVPTPVSTLAVQRSQY